LGCHDGVYSPPRLISSPSAGCFPWFFPLQGVTERPLVNRRFSRSSGLPSNGTCAGFLPAIQSNYVFWLVKFQSIVKTGIFSGLNSGEVCCIDLRR
jgi:hypothetical protein